MSFKRVTIYIILISAFISGLSIFVSSQLTESDLEYPITQKVNNFLNGLFKLRPTKETAGPINNSSLRTYKENLRVKPSNSNDLLIYEMADKDFKTLKPSSDKRLFNVQSINWQIRDNEISKQSLQKSLSINIDKKSSVALEIEVFSQTEQSEKLTIIQFSYTDVSNGNKIHEFSRMYQQGKKKPD